jgi:hypothetical protein
VEEVLELNYKGEDLSVLSGASTTEIPLSAQWDKSFCGCGTGTVWNPEKAERPPLKVGARGLVKGYKIEKTQYVL